jgi:membrane-associated phospholipid phosphatase
MLRFLADYTLVVIIAVSAAVLLYDGVKRGAWRQYPYLIMAGLTSLLFGKLLSLAYQPSEERPFLSQGVAAGAAFIDNPGFPSDHALLGVVVVVGVYALTGRRSLSVGLAGIVVIMMVARVLALVHTPLDIFGGLIAGLFGALWYLAMRANKA